MISTKAHVVIVRNRGWVLRMETILDRGIASFYVVGIGQSLGEEAS